MLLYCDDISSMTDEQFDLFFGLMPTERQKKAMRYVKKEDRQLNVVAYAMLGYALSLYGYKIGDCELSKTEKGKPYFKNLSLNFSLSHTENAVACAVLPKEIGVDIQKKSAEYIRVMRRVCCENEINFVSASKNPSADFVKLWTLKESYVKCIGTGISNNISNYDFSVVAQNGNGKLYGYDFLTFDIGECVISVCSSTPVEQIKNISITELEAFCKNMQ